MAAGAANELESVANAALLLALQSLLGGDTGNGKDGVEASAALDRLLLSGTNGFDGAGPRSDTDSLQPSTLDNSFEGGADATVRLPRSMP